MEYAAAAALAVAGYSFMTRKPANLIPKEQQMYSHFRLINASPRRRVITDDTPMFDNTPDYGVYGQAHEPYYEQNVRAEMTKRHSPVVEPRSNYSQRTETATNHHSRIPSPIHQSITSSIASTPSMRSTTRKRLFMDIDDQTPYQQATIQQQPAITYNQSASLLQHEPMQIDHSEPPAPKKRRENEPQTEVRRRKTRPRTRTQETPVQRRVLNMSKTTSHNYQFELGDGWETREDRLKRIQNATPAPLKGEPLKTAMPLPKPILVSNSTHQTPKKPLLIAHAPPSTPSARFKVPYAMPESARRRIVPSTPLKEVLSEEQMDERVIGFLQSAGKKAGFEATEQPKKMMPHSSPAPASFGKPVVDSVEGTPVKEATSFTFAPVAKVDDVLSFKFPQTPEPSAASSVTPPVNALAQTSTSTANPFTVATTASPVKPAFSFAQPSVDPLKVATPFTAPVNTQSAVNKVDAAPPLFSFGAPPPPVTAQPSALVTTEPVKSAFSFGTFPVAQSGSGQPAVTAASQSTPAPPLPRSPVNAPSLFEPAPAETVTAVAPTNAGLGAPAMPSFSFGGSSAVPAPSAQPTATASFGFNAPTPAGAAPTAPSMFSLPPASTVPATSLFSTKPASTSTPTPGAFSFGGQNAAPVTFGQAAPSTVQFGQQPATAPSLFGQAATATPSLFGQPASATSTTQPAFTAPSLFGQKSDTTNGQTAAPFGQSISTPPVLFGQGSTAPVPSFGQQPAAPASTFGQQPSSTPMFGQPPVSAPSFGQQPAASTSMFGQSGNAPLSFGQQPTAPSAFGQPSASGPFGNSSAPTMPFGSSAPSSTAFGASAAPSTGFGSSTPSMAFGAAAAPKVSFGASAAPSMSFGGSTPNFGGSSTPSFGSTQNSMSAQAAPSAFGSAAAPASTFGQSAPSAFGASSNTTFGQQVPSSFGQQAAFGQPQANAFGSSTPQQPASFSFGQPQPQPAQAFGQQPAFNAQPQQNFSFGSSAPTSTPSAFSFGQQSAPANSGFQFNAGTQAAPQTSFNMGATGASTLNRKVAPKGRAKKR